MDAQYSTKDYFLCVSATEVMLLLSHSSYIVCISKKLKKI